MPTPRKNEKKSDFISRCIPFVIHEGTTKDPKQAAAICHSIWRKHHPGAKSRDEINKSIDEILNQIDEMKARLPHISGGYTPYVPTESVV